MALSLLNPPRVLSTAGAEQSCGSAIFPRAAVAGLENPALEHHVSCPGEDPKLVETERERA
jgi:hypothetical protein